MSPHDALVLNDRPRVDRQVKLKLDKLIECVTVELSEEQISPAFLVGLGAHAQVRIPDAERAYLSVLDDDPSHAGALLSLAVLRLVHGDFRYALASIEKAIEEIRNNTEAKFWFGCLLLNLGKCEEGIGQLRNALSRVPSDVRIEVALADALRRTPRHVEALAHVDHAIIVDETYAGAWSTRGQILTELGRLDEARVAFEKAISLAPLSATNYLRLADLTALPVNSAPFHMMEKLARDNTNLLDSERSGMHFALGRSCEQSGDYRDALQHYVNANAIARPSIRYNERESLRWLEQIKEVFASRLLAQRCGEPSNVPVFIVGMPRSGSTLIEQVLASHPGVFGAGEIPDFEASMRSVLGGRSARACLNKIQDGISCEDLRKIGVNYVAALGRYSERADRVANKFLGNFQWVGMIHLALPNAKIIHARRNPVDTCVSCFSKFIPVPSSFDLREMGRHYRAYSALMDYWQTVLPPLSVLDVYYEDVVADCECQARRIVQFCGLEWDETCLRFYENQRVVRTASNAQVRRPIYTGSVGRWHGFSDMLRSLYEGLGEELTGLPGVTQRGEETEAGSSRE
jgi:tetratricopeptide (TPR) repeat protein